MSEEGKEQSNEYLPTATLTFNKQPKSYEIIKSLVKQTSREIHHVKVFWFELFYIMLKKFPTLYCPALTSLQITECNP